ncbi:helix-turn-helix domain-containing protein [Enterobacter hormaechei]|uniref:helix-turn-helix domain-containing protein n=1 Tax=Enterobacter hormaechei TaxID=158836 RepID=UPI003C71AC6F
METRQAGKQCKEPDSPDKGHARQQLAIIYGVGVSTLYRYFPVEVQRKDNALGL